MDLSITYTKTGRGMRAAIKKLPADAGKILRLIEKPTTGEEIFALTKKINKKDFEVALSWLLDGKHIKIVATDDFPQSIWEPPSKDAFKVKEISFEQFNVNEKEPSEADVIKKTKTKAEEEATALVYYKKAKAEALETEKAEAKAHKREEARIAKIKTHEEKIAATEEKARLKEEADQEEIRLKEEAEALETEKAEAEIHKREEEEKEEAKLKAKAEKEEAKLKAKAEKEEAKLKAKAEKEEAANLKSKTLHKEINFNALKKSNKKWMSYFFNIIKKILLISSISVALLLIIAQFANLHILINPIEKIASETFLQRVKVQTIHASIIPQPHLILEGFTIGDSTTVSAQKIRIYPNLLTLKEKINTITEAPYDISSIEIDGLNFSQSDMPEMNTWASNTNTNKLLKIKKIILNKTSAQLNGIGPLIINSDVFLNEKNQFNNAIITTEDKNLTVSVQGAADNYLIDIEGTRWRLPISPNPIFTQLKAKGSFKDNILTLSSIEGALYKGIVNANLTSNLAKNWDTQGNFKLNYIRLIDIAQDIKYDSVIEGKLDTSGSFSFNINKSSNQVDALKIKAKFKVNNGLIKKIDLVEAMRSGRANGATSFTKFSGNAYVNKRNYQFNNLLLRENQLHATGSLRISPTKKVTGVVSSQISVKQKSIKSRFKIAGSTDRINLVN